MITVTETKIVARRAQDEALARFFAAGGKVEYVKPNVKGAKKKAKKEEAVAQ